MISWNNYFRKIAQVASERSKDKHTQLGAIIVGPDKEIISTGYNSLPRGMNDKVPERFERPEKYFWMEHAERNAIYNAARLGSSTKDSTLYLSRWFPCVECTRAIINSGIKSIFCDRIKDDESNPQYVESFKRSLTMLNEANVTINYYE